METAPLCAKYLYSFRSKVPRLDSSFINIPKKSLVRLLKSGSSCYTNSTEDTHETKREPKLTKFYAD